VHPDLTPAWSVSLRNILNDGCDVGLPPNGTPGGCRAGSSDGLIHAQNNGHLFVVGNSLRRSPVSAGKKRRPRAVGPH
jgi:hypothetical protein